MTTVRDMARSLCLLAVCIWHTAAGWHLAMHPHHHHGRTHLETTDSCGAHDHQHSHDIAATEPGWHAGNTDASTRESRHCHACAVAAMHVLPAMAATTAHPPGHASPPLPDAIATPLRVALLLHPVRGPPA